jgi:hypothetical protein
VNQSKVDFNSGGQTALLANHAVMSDMENRTLLFGIRSTRRQPLDTSLSINFGLACTHSHSWSLVK